MTAGERLVAQALKYEGTHEVPLGSNDDQGGPITRWQTVVGLVGLPASKKPYCGTFVKNMHLESGVPDDGLASPSTWAICARADALGGCAPKAGRPVPPGSYIVKCGTHVGLVVRDLGNGLLATIEGNVSDGVYRKVRDRSEWRVVVPLAVAADAAPAQELFTFSYGFDDLSIKPILYGGWAAAATRDQRMGAYRGAHPGDWTRPVRISAPAPYAFWAGPAGTYGEPWEFGGWPSKGMRDEKAAAYLGAHPEARLRMWAKSVPTVTGGTVSHADDDPLV